MFGSQRGSGPSLTLPFAPLSHIFPETVTGRDVLCAAIFLAAGQGGPLLVQRLPHARAGGPGWAAGESRGACWELVLGMGWS